MTAFSKHLSLDPCWIVAAKNTMEISTKFITNRRNYRPCCCVLSWESVVFVDDVWSYKNRYLTRCIAVTFVSEKGTQES